MAYGNILGAFTEYNSSGSDLVNTTITTPVLQGEMTMCPHCFIGVTFTDNDGAAVTPGAGTYTVTVETINNPGVFEPISGGTSVDATAALTTLSWAGNTTRVQVVSDSITTATKIKFKITANVS